MCTAKTGAGRPPRSLMVAMVTLAADREWTFLCRQQEDVNVVTAFRENFKTEFCFGKVVLGHFVTIRRVLKVEKSWLEYSDFFCRNVLVLQIK